MLGLIIITVVGVITILGVIDIFRQTKSNDIKDKNDIIDNIMDKVIFILVAGFGCFLAYWCVTFAYTAIKAILFN